MRLGQRHNAPSDGQASTDQESTHREVQRAKSQAILEGKLDRRTVLGDRASHAHGPTSAAMVPQGSNASSRSDASSADASSTRGDPNGAGARVRRRAMDVPAPAAPKRAGKLRQARNSIDLGQRAPRSADGQRRADGSVNAALDELFAAVVDLRDRKG